MPTFDPTDLIGRTFLLPPEENGERHRAKVTRMVVEIIGRLGRSHMNPSPSLQLMTPLPVQQMPKKMIYLL